MNHLCVAIDVEDAPETIAFFKERVPSNRDLHFTKYASLKRFRASRADTLNQ